jgi:penicillin-binding protein 1A
MSEPSPAADPGARHWLVRALAWAVGLAVAGLLTLGLAVGVALAVAYPNLPSIASLTDYRPKQPLRVFTADGVQIGEFGEERRNFTPIERIPKRMKDAVLAA